MKSTGKLLIACDFDGVLCLREGIPRVKGETGVPTDGALSAIEFLLTLGHEIYILTARSFDDFPLIREWLDEHNFPSLEITNSKKEGTKVIIDDRAIRFTNWMDICKYFG